MRIYKKIINLWILKTFKFEIPKNYYNVKICKIKKKTKLVQFPMENAVSQFAT